MIRSGKNMFSMTRLKITLKDELRCSTVRSEAYNAAIYLKHTQ